MARKSGWQQFAENFNSVYGTYKNVAQDVEAGRVMDDEKFTAEGKAGYGLAGTELEKARYKALGDIYTKYGNAKEGLAVRQQLAGLESSERENAINQATMQHLIDQQGILQSLAMKANTGLANASAGNQISQTNQRDTMLPLDFALGEQKLRFDTTTADLAERTLQPKVALSFSEADTADTNAALNRNKLYLSDATLPAETDATVAQFRSTEALADLEKFRNRKLLEGASEESAILYAANSNPNMSEKDATAWAIDNITTAQKMDPIRKKELIDALNGIGLGKLQQEAAVITQSALNALQVGGLDGVVSYYDTVDDAVRGQRTAMRVERSADGVRIISRVGGKESVFLEATGADAEAVLTERFMAQIKDPGTAMTVAGRAIIFEQEKAKLRNENQDFVKGLQDIALTGVQIDAALLTVDKVKLEIAALKDSAGSSERARLAAAQKALTELTANADFVSNFRDNPEAYKKALQLVAEQLGLSGLASTQNNGAGLSFGLPPGFGLEKVE